jgi:hypothetical protein
MTRRPSKRPVGRDFRPCKPASRAVERRGETNRVRVVVRVDRNELANLAETDLALVERRERVRRTCDLEGRGLACERLEHPLEHERRRRHGGGNMKLPPLKGRSGAGLAYVHPGAPVRVLGDLPGDSGLAGAELAHALGERPLADPRRHVAVLSLPPLFSER